MTRLSQLIDSNYIGASNRLIKKDISAHVEGFDDINFWHDIFRKYAPSLKIEFLPYSHDLSSGKEVVLTEENIRNAGEHLILCVDSDYDFLIGDERLSNPYIFHTYTYSIENYKISPTGLTSIVKKACFISTIDFDFKSFLEDYSKCIYELFLYILYCKKHGETEELLTTSKLKKIIALKPKDIDTIQQGHDWLNDVKEGVQQHIAQIKEKYPNITNAKLQDTLNQCQEKTGLTINQSNLFLYVNGHIVYELIRRLLKIIVDNCHNENKTRIKEQENVQGKQIGDKINEYNNKTKINNWETLLNNNYLECLMYEENCPTIEKVKQDIENFYISING